jgi:predicted dehydrogenase
MGTLPVKVGVVGCGAISGAYFGGMKQFSILETVACADLDLDKAKAKAKENGIRACTVKKLLADPEIEIVLNLTVPKAHAEINLAALEAGKHVYVEKPLAATRDLGLKTLAAAKAGKLRVGSAPDTFFGGSHQTCRKLIDDGWIGEPVAATAFMLCHGHESWHPSPEFYYEVGGGPMFDMGPYYLTALVNLLGPARRLTASARVTFPERTITSQPKHGKKVRVETPTHIAGVIDFMDGAVCTIITSFDVWGHHLPCIEIYGSEGSLRVPDPNGFGGPVTVFRPGKPAVALREGSAKNASASLAPWQWVDMDLTHGYTGNMRGIGVADMAQGIRTGRPHRASGDLAMHVLDMMQGFLEASEEDLHHKMKTRCDRPAMLPLGLKHGELDE